METGGGASSSGGSASSLRGQEGRVKKFKELVKSGMSMRRALKGSGLHPRYYKKHYVEIWSDPELEPYRPERFRELMAKKRSGAEYVGASKHGSVLEGELEDLELKRQSLLRAADKVHRLFGAPGTSPSAGVDSGAGEKPKDVIEEFERAFRDFEAKRARVREVLEGIGFKIEDVYMRRDEVERLVEEVRRKAAEEALDDKRIEAVENIICNAISKLIEMFKPAVQAFFIPEKELGRQTVQSTPEEGSGRVVEAGSK